MAQFPGWRARLQRALLVVLLVPLAARAADSAVFGALRAAMADPAAHGLWLRRWAQSEDFLETRHLLAEASWRDLIRWSTISGPGAQLVELASQLPPTPGKNWLAGTNAEEARQLTVVLAKTHPRVAVLLSRFWLPGFENPRARIGALVKSGLLGHAAHYGLGYLAWAGEETPSVETIQGLLSLTITNDEWRQVASTEPSLAARRSFFENTAQAEDVTPGRIRALVPLLVAAKEDPLGEEAANGAVFAAAVPAWRKSGATIGDVAWALRNAAIGAEGTRLAIAHVLPDVRTVDDWLTLYEPIANARFGYAEWSVSRELDRLALAHLDHFMALAPSNADLDRARAIFPSHTRHWLEQLARERARGPLNAEQWVAMTDPAASAAQLTPFEASVYARGTAAMAARNVEAFFDTKPSLDEVAQFARLRSDGPRLDEELEATIVARALSGALSPGAFLTFFQGSVSQHWSPATWVVVSAALPRFFAAGATLEEATRLRASLFRAANGRSLAPEAHAKFFRSAQRLLYTDPGDATAFFAPYTGEQEVVRAAARELFLVKLAQFERAAPSRIAFGRTWRAAMGGRSDALLDAAYETLRGPRALAYVRWVNTRRRSPNGVLCAWRLATSRFYRVE